MRGAVAFVLGFVMMWFVGWTVAHAAMEMVPHPNQEKTNSKDPYDGLYNWDGELCCSNNDCQQARHPEDFKPVAGGILIKPTGEVAPPGKQGISPDGQWHICRWPIGTTLRCVLIPNGGV